MDNGAASVPQAIRYIHLVQQAAVNGTGIYDGPGKVLT